MMPEISPRLQRLAGIFPEWLSYDKLPNKTVPHLRRLPAPAVPLNQNVSNFWGFTKGRLAGAAGLEPATGGFGDRCSTKLSYTPALIYQVPLVRVERTTRGLGNRCSIL